MPRPTWALFLIMSMPLWPPCTRDGDSSLRLGLECDLSRTNSDFRLDLRLVLERLQTRLGLELRDSWTMLIFSKRQMSSLLELWRSRTNRFFWTAHKHERWEPSHGWRGAVLSVALFSYACFRARVSHRCTQMSSSARQNSYRGRGAPSAGQPFIAWWY